MPQTVFDPGDPITSRLKLGVTPDGSTIASVSVRRPDGTLIAGLTPSSFGGTGGDEKTVQWYATDDGTVGGTRLAVGGDWLAVWTVTGTGASVSPKLYAVQPFPDPSGRATYAPFLHEIADFVPWLTLDKTIPGGDTFLGTFTGGTWPTDEQVWRHVRRVVDPIAAHWPSLSSGLAALGRSYVALKVAAHLARAFPRNSGDLGDAEAWNREADLLWAQFVELAENENIAPSGTGQMPIYAFPTPVSWGDDYL